ncbi:DNA-directed RNA polymerase III subunit RPC7 isoform X7 [Ovis aries]|uniref:DNA-directed RNA polymerase III subunit RPC7 isoform X7 n=2 Tax=Ovis TaxID=9935 RepID=UPI0029528C34|nr:DNA-directed RNA polymerase III subunit RPC7 isoform X7 [Ovis aries]
MRQQAPEKGDRGGGVRITVLQDEGGLHRLHSELPGPPARARRPHHLAVGQPGHGLEVVPAGQRLGLGVVHRHPVELVEAARVVEVHVGSHGQQRPARRVFSGRAVPQEAGGVQVLGEAAQPQAGVDHHVLLGAPHQPDVGAVARLVEAFLNPEDAVAQGLVGVPLERRHAARVPMAGNKGRGRAAYTFNIEAVGFSRGDKLPDVVLKPPPLFPDTDYKPVPLKTGESEDYVLALKQELRETVKRMPYFVETPEEKQGAKSKKAEDAGKGPSLTNPVDVLKKIEELEKKGEGEKSDEENEEKEGGKEKSKEGDDDEEDDAAEQEEYDEEEQEEENDYINSYFEDGDDFGADSDDNMDEATY